MFENKIIVYASGVRSYGGLSLIQALVDCQDPRCVFILNDQVELERYPAEYTREKGGYRSMFSYEFNMRKDFPTNAVIFAITNRPLFWKQKAYVVTLLASVYAIEVPDNVPTTLSRRLKSYIQIFLNRFLKRNTDMFLARSKEMVDVCERITKWPTTYLPFLTHSIDLKRSLKSDRERINGCRFFYPSDDSPHKNHKRLFHAWRLLSEEGVDCKLYVTISDLSATSIDPNYRSYGIEAVGYLPENELNRYFKLSDSLIFPSLLESFPLAVIEARNFNLPIVASERRFIREQVDPEESFDPLCEHSMASAVKRFVGDVNVSQELPDTLQLIEFLWRLKRK